MIQNAEGPLSIQTYDGGNQPGHPTVIYCPHKLFGYAYWMAYTPLHRMGYQHEDPCIVCSTDGTRWVEPHGFTNPVDKAKRGHNSDPELLLDPSGTKLWLFWRWTDMGSKEIIWASSTTNGVTWAPRKAIITYREAWRENLCPQILWDGERFCMWTMSAGKHSGKVRVRYAQNPLGPWSSAEACSVPMDVWHADVQRLKCGEYLMFAQLGLKVYLLRSNDGVSWGPATKIMEGILDNWDEQGIYQLCSIEVGDKLEIYYQGNSRMTDVHIGRTWVNKCQLP